MGWSSIPQGWKLQYESSFETLCEDLRTFRVDTFDRTCWQARDTVWKSGGYSFYNAKRHAKALDGDTTSKDCQKADTFFHENGQQYDITSMNDDQVSELVALAKNGTAPVDFPEVFKALEKSE